MAGVWLACCAGSAVGVQPADSADSAATARSAEGDIVLVNSCCRYVISASGANAAFVDLATGQDYCASQPPAPFVRARIAGQWRAAVSATGTADGIRVALDGTTATIEVRAQVHPRYFVMSVTAASGDVEQWQFVNLPLTLRGRPDEPFAACALALNLQTNVPGIPSPSARLEAHCVPRFGVVGAAAAIVACPPDQMRDVLKEVVSAAGDQMPKSPVGGPWAWDAEINRASYLFANPTEQTVDEVIRTVKSVGFNQVQIHGGRGTYRFGDCLPNPKLYPQGVASVRAVVDRLHEAGIYVGMHPYAFFIDKATPWVSPIPDRGLAVDAAFTLTADVSAEDASIPVRESVAAMSTVTGFFVRNSVTLRIDDELITYGGLSTDGPQAFTQCTRGAWGTTAAAHAADASVHHLKECFGLFLPDPDSALFTQVIEANADFFNACGFDTLYLDALDGEDTLGGRENAWHYGSKFVWELWRRLARPAAFEYSTFHHHLWVLRSRHGAWDHPTRAYRQFIDQHVAANEANTRMFLPSHLGWWAFKTWQPPQAEPTFADDIEYWCAKALGTNSGLSLQGYNLALPGHQRLATIVRRYEQLRRSGDCGEAMRRRLCEPGAEFQLEAAPSGGWQFRPVRTTRHRACSGDGWSDRWTVHNPHQSQAPAVRIEALQAVGPYDGDAHLALAEFDAPAEFAAPTAAPGVTAQLEPLAEGETRFGRLTAHNATPARRGAWASFKKTFTPPLDLDGKEGIGVWVRGDGQGEVLNFQLQSPSHLSHARAERYVVVDFEGWRYVPLVELDAERYAEYGWPYAADYSVYREAIRPNAIESLTIWCNNLPPADSITVDIRPIRALPLVAARVVNPQLTIGGRTMVFPIEIASGSYLEIEPTGAGQLYGAAGEPLDTVRSTTVPPVLDTGENHVAFASQAAPGPAARARVSIRVLGEPSR